MIDYIWRHAPAISAPPSELIEERTNIEDGEVTQKAIFQLENDKYLYILYNGMIDNISSGITDLEEFDELKDAMEVFDE